MIEFISFDGHLTKINILGYCKTKHPLIMWEMKPKGALDLIPCPICSPEVKR